MKDPTRLRDSTHFNEAGRRALEAAHGLEPPAGEGGRVWAALGSRLPLTGGELGEGGLEAGSPGALGTAGASAATAGISLAKVAGVLATVTALGGIGGAVFFGVRESSSPPDLAPPASSAGGGHVAAVTARSVVSRARSVPSADREAHRANDARAAAGSRPSAATTGPHVGPERAAMKPPSGAAPSSALSNTAAFHVESASTTQPRAGAMDDATAIAEESRLVGNARLALRANDASTALALLERADGRFPRGILTQERSALFVEALARAGRRDEARARARSFLASFPNSPHGSRVRALLDRP